MQVTCDGNWFSVDPTTAPAAAAGAEMLAARTEPILGHLHMATLDCDDVEHVHRLRVGCRRAAAALRSFRCLAGQSARQLDRRLKSLRRAAGPARDLDVHLARLGAVEAGHPLEGRLRMLLIEKRTQAQLRLERLAAKSSRGGFERAARRCAKALRSAGRRGGTDPFDVFAADALAHAARDVLAYGNLAQAPLARLHELRIAGKRLRYAIELFHSAIESPLAHGMYDAVESLQERLGALNDHATSQAMYQAWLAEMPADDFAAMLGRRIAEEWDDAERLRHDFLAWWTTERREPIARFVQQHR